MEIKTEFLKYSQDSFTDRGWGCGYVLIPKGHPYRVVEKLNEDVYFYPQIEGFSEEITYSEVNELGELKIGFDTAHSYCNAETHNETFVRTKTYELKTLIENFTKDDAQLFALEYVTRAEEKVNSILNDY